MILLWGLLEDETTRSVYDRLQRRNAEVFFLNHAAIDRTRIRLTMEGSFSYLVTCGEESCRLEDFAAAYLRPYDFRDYDSFAGKDETSDAFRRAQLVHHLMHDWAEHSGGVIIHKPSAEATNHSKLYQSLQIQSSGFSVPDSIVTNDPDEVLRFRSEHGRIIYKSMSSVRSVVKEFRAEDAASWNQEPMGPAFFQQHVAGSNIRVHVVADQAFSCSIESDAVDYRYASSTIRAVNVPEGISRQCVQLTRNLELLLAGIDLIRTPRDEWYCLEVNPNPGFSHFESGEDRPIAQAVAELLLAGSPSSL